MDRTAANRERIEKFIQDESAAFYRTLRHYLSRSGLFEARDLDEAAQDLLNEVVVEALGCLDRLTPEIPPRAWLLGIAANLIKREQVAHAKRQRREPLIRDLYTAQQDALSDEELFDLLPTVEYSPDTELEVNQNLDGILPGLTKKDADCLRLAILRDMDGNALAEMLGISVNAARVRMHRALNRLREIHIHRRNT